jgi:hypothetical protein
VKRAIKVLLGHDSAITSTDINQLQSDAQQYWAASKTETIKQDLSHWRGVGRWAEDKAWKQIGEDHQALYQSLLRLTNRTNSVQSMIEWGPGGGANASRFCQDVPMFTAVDISQANLDECGRQLATMGYTGYHPVLIPADKPKAALDQIPTPVDFFLCTAVYQHFPGKEYGRQVTQIAHQLLRPDGVALIQTRYDDGSPQFQTKVRDYHANVVTFTSYRIEEFWMIAAECGFRPLAVTLNPTVNYAFYFLAKT